MANSTDGSFSLTRGGPFYRLLVRIRARAPVHFWMLGLLLWLPMTIGEAVRLMMGLPLDPVFKDFSSHARLLFALPALLMAERLLDMSSQSALKSFINGHFCEREPIDRVLETAAHLRDSWRIEAALLLVALVGGQLVLWRVFGVSGVFSAGEAAGFWSFPRVWYAAIALPIVQFVLLRWLFRWLVWSYVLGKLSRLQLSPLATHPDFAAGLAGLARPISGFSGFVLATSGILAAAWGTQVYMHDTPVQAVLPGLTVFLVLACALGLVPLLAFSGHLYRTRRQTLAMYGDLARDYVVYFHDKWIVDHRREDLLGTPDIQSLSDLGNSFQVVQKTRTVIFSPRHVLAIWFAALAPMVPLFTSKLTFEHVLNRILRTVVGGLPF